MRDKNEDEYKGGEGKTPVATACSEGRSGLNLLRVEPESEVMVATRKGVALFVFIILGIETGEKGRPKV